MDSSKNSKKTSQAFVLQADFRIHVLCAHNNALSFCIFLTSHAHQLSWRQSFAQWWACGAFCRAPAKWGCLSSSHRSTPSCSSIFKHNRNKFEGEQLNMTFWYAMALFWGNDVEISIHIVLICILKKSLLEPDSGKDTRNVLYISGYNVLHGRQLLTGRSRNQKKEEVRMQTREKRARLCGEQWKGKDWTLDGAEAIKMHASGRWKSLLLRNLPVLCW